MYKTQCGWESASRGWPDINIVPLLARQLWNYLGFSVMYFNLQNIIVFSDKCGDRVNDHRFFLFTRAIFSRSAPSSVEFGWNCSVLTWVKHVISFFRSVYGTDIIYVNNVVQKNIEREVVDKISKVAGRFTECKVFGEKKTSVHARGCVITCGNSAVELIAGWFVRGQEVILASNVSSQGFPHHPHTRHLTMDFHQKKKTAAETAFHQTRSQFCHFFNS